MSFMKISKLFFIKTILKEGKWFFIIPLLIIVLSLSFQNFDSPFNVTILSLCVIVMAYTIFFLRPPTHFPDSNDSLIFSSADGKILDIEKNVDCPYLPGEKFHKITIFMHVANLHWNQSPIDGTIIFEEFHSGQFQNAFKIVNSWQDNEHQVIGLENKKLNIKVVVIMVAGLIARRIRFMRHPFEKLKQGDILGLIRYGSANILYIPANYELLISNKQKTRAGKTILAKKP